VYRNYDGRVYDVCVTIDITGGEDFEWLRRRMSSSKSSSMLQLAPDFIHDGGRPRHPLLFLYGVNASNKHRILCDFRLARTDHST